MTTSELRRCPARRWIVPVALVATAAVGATSTCVLALTDRGGEVDGRSGIVAATTTAPLSIVLATTSSTTTTAPLPIALATTTSSTTTTPADQPPRATTTLPTIAPPTVGSTTTAVINLVTPTLAPSTVPATTTALVLAAATTVPPAVDPADVPIGVIDTSGAVPDGLDLSAIPGAEAGPPAADAPVTAGLTCIYQCIASGVAYARGFGAELEIVTYVPAEIMLIAIGDTDDDGEYEHTEFTSSGAMVSDFSWALDHLDPGQTYFVTVAATDENGDASHAFGQFTTLSERTVNVVVDDLIITGGPTNIEDTDVSLSIDGGSLVEFPPIGPSEFVYDNRGRFVDLMLQVERQWETAASTVCETSPASVAWPQGDSDSSCSTWNSATLDHRDVDVVPTDRSRWTVVSFDETLTTPVGGADDFPPGFGDPRYFDFSAPVEVTITYS